MTQTIKGRGVVSWNSTERRTDRYGGFALDEAGYGKDATYQDAKWDENPMAFEGHKCRITATVLVNRESEHIGDIFRGLFPETPDVGEVIDLGTGTLRTENWGYALGVLLVPDDGRANDWMDPVKLYRLHDQSVEVTITRIG